MVSNILNTISEKIDEVYPKRMIDKFGHCFLILGGEPEEKFV